MSTYPGPEYLRTGEYGECEHGTPDNYDCTECQKHRLDRLHDALDDLIDACNNYLSNAPWNTRSDALESAVRKAEGALP